MKGSSNEGQFKKARKTMGPEFFGKSGSGSAKAKGNVMDKENPKALRLANGGSARQPRSGSMKFVKRDMGGMIGGDAPMLPGRTPTVDSEASMLGPQVKNPPALGVAGRMGATRNPPALGVVRPPVRGGIGTVGAGGRGLTGIGQGTIDPGQDALGKLAASRPMKPAVMPTPEPVPPMMMEPQMGGDNGGGFKRGGAVPRNKLSRLATGGAAKAPVKLAAGGVGKQRHSQATPEGKPKAAPKGKKLFEAI